MSLFHRVLSFAIACASPHDKPISLSSVSTVFLQVVLGLPLFLLPAGVHLRATLGILSDDIRKTCPSHLSRRFLISRSILVHPSLLVQVIVGNFVGPEDVADPSQTAVVKNIDFIYVPLDNSPAFRAVQYHRFNVTVVDAHFSLKAILLRLPDVSKSTKCTPGFVKPSLDVLMGTVICTDHTPEVSKLFSMFQPLSIDVDWP